MADWSGTGNGTKVPDSFNHLYTPKGDLPLTTWQGNHFDMTALGYGEGSAFAQGGIGGTSPALFKVRRSGAWVDIT